MTISAIDFDPYRVWLNIQEPSRPPNPYQLLGLVSLEADSTRIRAGFQRQKAVLSTWAGRGDAQLWESVSQEIEQAYELLCDIEQKAVLDAAIRRRGVRANGKLTLAPAATAEGSLTCRHCQRSNPPARRFCGDCGKPLWEKCPQCSAECGGSERFCGACGADIHGELNQQRQQFEARINQALALAAAHRYDAALSALRGVAASDDPRLCEFATRALDEIEKLQCARKTFERAAANSLVQAFKFMEAHSYESAQQAIEDVPAPLRTDEHSQLLERARACREELLALSGEIRQAVEQKRTVELLPKLTRLLTLKPNHAQARQLTRVLCENLVKTAKARLGQHRYREALDALERIPSLARNEEAASLAETAGELDTLMQAIRTAALADQPLLGLAERFCKLVPGNPEAASLRSQVADRLKAQPSEPRLGAANWSPPPARTALGVPVDWLAHLMRPQRASESVSKTLEEHPGQFFTAFGLALAGLGLAATGAELTPQARSGMLGVLPALSFGRRRISEAWGLDLSDYALKAIKLAPAGAPGEVVIKQCEYILHRMPLAHPDAETDRLAINTATLQDFVARAGELKNVKLCTGLAGQRVLGRFFDLPPMASKKVLAAIQYETQHQLPISLDELYWSHEVLDERSGKEADLQPRRVLVQAAREAHVAERIALFKQAGIAIDVVQSECAALHNAIVHELLPGADGATAPGAIAAIDVGTEGVNLVVSAPRCIWFRAFSPGGSSFTRALANELKLTCEQAEQLKRDPAKARSFSRFDAAIQPLLTQLAGEVERSLATYARLYAEHPVTRVYGLGGGFQLPGLLRRLRTGR